MGDRCRLTVTVYAPHARACAQTLDLDEAEDANDAGHPRYEVPEADYGLYNEREAAADAGLVFWGRHGAGGDYGAHEFVAVDGRLHECRLHEGRRVRLVDGDGGEFENFLRAAAKVDALLARPVAITEIEEAAREDVPAEG